MAKMLFSYADDSATHRDSEFSLLIGYIGSPRQWKSFNAAWQDALSPLDMPDGAKREFHAHDFFNTLRWGSSKSPYREWDLDKGWAFLNQLLDIIHRHDVRPIGGATNTEAFFERSEEDRMWLTGAVLETRTNWEDGEFVVSDKFTGIHRRSRERPYFINFDGFLVEALRASEKADGANLHLVFDSNDDVESRAKQASNEFKANSGLPNANKLKGTTYSYSEDEPGLQAADMYAYVMNRHLCNKLNSRYFKRAYKVLTKKRKKIFVADRDYFSKLLMHGARHRQAGIEKGRAVDAGHVIRS
jgi:hypothetical protein